MTPSTDPARLLERLGSGRSSRIRHVADLPERPAQVADWPDWVPDEVTSALARRGISAPWRHQVTAAELAHAGNDVVLATGTASGKSLGYLMPALSAIHTGTGAPDGRGATVLYLAPTKALAHDQLRGLRELELPWLRAAAIDGDASPIERDWARAHANLVLTNPDFIHHSLLGNHRMWGAFLRRLQVIVIDECHAYRGVFGSHVSAILRRARRAADHYGTDPVIMAASATVAEPAIALARLTGRPAAAVIDDASPQARKLLAFWEPADLGVTDDDGDPLRRSVTGETAELLADLVVEGQRTLAFVRSRRGSEAVALAARAHLDEVDPSLAERVAAYRAGYLPEERRALEQQLRDGHLLGVASTNALELGIDISGLDAVIVAGWPGTRASMWQQVGRAGRGDDPSLAIFVAREDPLDAYIVAHPQSVLGRPVEASVFDPENRYVLAPHLCAAAAEFPLTDDDAVHWFGPTAPERLTELGAAGLLRRRPAGWFWTSRDRASDLADLRNTGGPPVSIVEEGTGRLLGSLDNAAAHVHLHPGAVYLHQGVTYLVTDLDLEATVATVVEEETDIVTDALQTSDVEILRIIDERGWPGAQLTLGEVRVTERVVGFTKRRAITNQMISTHPLDLPPRELVTVAVWWTIAPTALNTLDLPDLAGAAHAAEHASIGLLPLFATCDRWDIGGLSTPMHPDTGMLTVFVYDGYPGGAGFAEHGFAIAEQWLSATRALIDECACQHGCPSCVQSPKCGNGNEPLDASGAVQLLDLLLAGASTSP